MPAKAVAATLNLVPPCAEPSFSHLQRLRPRSPDALAGSAAVSAVEAAPTAVARTVAGEEKPRFTLVEWAHWRGPGRAEPDALARQPVAGRLAGRCPGG